MSSVESPAESLVKAKPAKSKSTLVIAAAAVVGLGAGYFVVGPKLAGPPAVDGAVASAEGHGEEKEEKEGHGESRLVRVDNIVVNPAGSEGLRFLMVSVAFEVRDPEAEATLQGSEVQLRDAVTGVFERQTMAALTKPGARDSLRKELASALHPLIGEKKVRVYLPQFVIQ